MSDMAMLRQPGWTGNRRQRIKHNRRMAWTWLCL